MALYVVRVPQAGVLPTASFRFHLAMDTLAVQLMVDTANPIADFHCQAITHARRTRYPRLYRRGTFKTQALLVLFLPLLVILRIFGTLLRLSLP